MNSYDYDLIVIVMVFEHRAAALKRNHPNAPRYVIQNQNPEMCNISMLSQAIVDGIRAVLDGICW